MGVLARCLRVPLPYESNTHQFAEAPLPMAVAPLHFSQAAGIYVAFVAASIAGRAAAAGAGVVWLAIPPDQGGCGKDEARPADAIAVFGAAEYGGRPSPVLHARLDHAVELYREQMAPLVITLGGGTDLDQGMTEGGVGRDYLLANGVPYEQIVAETQSVDTEQQVRRLAEIARARHLNSIVVVSDGTHLFRVRKLCQDAGLTVYTSPRGTLGNIDDYDLALRYFHEMLSYTLLRLHVNVGWLHGRADA
jgi:uncharacterized SAM-binding protein YcdF (DUF218 family)